MATWPLTLPQEPDVGRWKENLVTKLLRTEMDAGVTNVRPRYTGSVWSFELNYQLHLAQVKILKSFVRTTLTQATDYFDFPHPGNRTETVSVRFREMPVYDFQGGDYYRVQFTLETEPLTTPPGLA